MDFLAAYSRWETTVKHVVLSALAWTALEVLSNLALKGWVMRLLDGNPKLRGRHKQQAAVATQAMPRVVCFMHNLIQVPLALLVLTNPAFQADPVHYHTDLSRLVMVISAGYFLYDTAECILRFDHEGWEFLLHGVFCGLVYANLLQSGALHFFGAGFLMWELSTPFLHLRWFLYKTGRDSSALYHAVTIGGMLVFFACRNFWGTYLSGRYILASRAALATPEGRAALPQAMVYLFAAALVALNGLNLYWAGKMVSLLVAEVRKTLGGSEGKRQKEARKKVLKAKAAQEAR